MESITSSLSLSQSGAHPSPVPPISDKEVYTTPFNGSTQFSSSPHHTARRATTSPHLACARSCWHLAVAAVQLPALLCCEAMVWTIAFLTFPVRLLAAVDRERKLDRPLGEMQGQMERVVWEKRELEERLRVALKERDTMEDILDEMEEEHEDAFTRIDLLENQLKALKKENMRLNEHKGKSMWDKAAAAAAAAHGNGGGKKADEPRAWEAAGKDKEEEAAEAQEDKGIVFGSGDPYLAASSPFSLTAAAEARLMRVTARRRSLFSLGMSLAVGGIAWSADAPCLPLLAGLLTVVGMSMCSVARLFHGRRSAATEGAVALLSLNWFLLGVLTYPMLPGVARAVLPRAARHAGPALAWLAAAVPV